VNEVEPAHPGAQVAEEQLNVAGMRCNARRTPASRYASNLAHIPAPVACGAAKRGLRVHKVNSAKSSLECQRRQQMYRENRLASDRLAVAAAGMPPLPTSTRRRAWRVGGVSRRSRRAPTARQSTAACTGGIRSGEATR